MRRNYTVCEECFLRLSRSFVKPENLFQVTTLEYFNLGLLDYRFVTDYKLPWGLKDMNITIC